MSDSDDALREQCPLFLFEEFDLTFPHAHWRIGLNSTYPGELKRRIAAAVISFQLGLRSVDYTLKKYIEDDYETGNPSRLDLRISSALTQKADNFSDLIFQVTCVGPKRQGQILSEWTYLRAPFSLTFLLSCANRGAFFEAIAIARTLLEQIAWASKIDSLDDAEAIKTTSASKAVSELRNLVPGAGRLYGWLSQHAHWAYEGHVKAMDFQERQLVSMFASTTFKAKSLALTIVMSIISIQAFYALKRGTIAKVLSCDQEQFTKRRRRSFYQSSPFEDLFGNEYQPRLSDLAGVDDCQPLFKLLGELHSYIPRDEDLLLLRSLVS